MEHVVFYPSNEGVASFERVDSIEAAVSFVEHLRNSENITEFEVHSLIAVPLSFRAYYHVEVPDELDGTEAPAAQADASDAAEEPEPAAEPVAEAEPEPEVAPEPEPVAEVVEEPVAEAEPEIEPIAEAEPEVDAAGPPAEADDDDRSVEWVAEAPVRELPVEVPALTPVAETAPASSGPFADAPPVTPTESEPTNPDVVPVPPGRRSMGFFAR